MKTNARLALTFVVLAIAGILALTHPAAQTTTPSAEVKKLERFIGTWNGKGDMKPSEFGPAGTMTWTETCEWYEGGKSHIVCRSKGQGPTGEVRGLSIMGYDPAAKVYTFYGVDNQGWSDFSTGTINGRTWSFTGRQSGRFSLTEVSDTKHTFTWEMSPDGKTWNTIMTGEASK